MATQLEKWNNRTPIAKGSSLSGTYGPLVGYQDIEVRKSSLQGYGVFAMRPFDKGEMIEECHWIEIDNNCVKVNPRNSLSEYTFGWPKAPRDNEQRIPLYFQNDQQTFVQKIALPLGYAAIYNSANLPQEANADWYTNEITNLFEFKAIRDIKAGEEICTYYGYIFDEE